MNAFESTVAEKSRRAITNAPRNSRIIAPVPVVPIAAAALFAGDGDEGVVQARPLDRERLDAGTAVDQRLEQRLGAALGKLEHPFVAFAASVWPESPTRQGPSLARVRRRTIGRKPTAGFVDAAVEGDLALGDDRNPLAQSLGMGDDVGREDDGRARRAPRAGSAPRAVPG